MQDRERVEAALARLAREGATGALQVRSGKARRSFFLKDGQLVQTASNVRKETTEWIAGQMPEASPETVYRFQSIMRMAAAIEEDSPELEWMPDRGTPHPLPLSLAGTLWAAMEMALEHETCRHLLKEAGPGNPVAVGEAPDEVGFLPTEHSREWLASLDGLRPLEEVLEFSPDEPDVAARAIYLGWLLGSVAFKPGGTEPQVFSRRANVPGDDEVHRLLASSLSRSAGEPAPAPEAPPAPPPQERKAVPDPVEVLIRGEIHRINKAPDYFQVLGAPWDSPVDQFRNSYHEIAKTLHPDRLGLADEDLIQAASAAFDRVREAWGTLREEESRRDYIDRVVHGKKTEEELAMEQVQEILASENLFRRAKAWFHAGQLVKAHGAFREAAVHLADQPEVRIFLGYTTWHITRSRSPEEAQEGLEMLQGALEEFDRSDEGWVLLGKAARGEGRDQDANQHFIRALKVNPDNKEAHRELERMKQKREKTRKGLLGFFKRRR